MTAPPRPSDELPAYAAKEEAAARAILAAAVARLRRYHPDAAVETLVEIAMHDRRVRAEVNHHRRLQRRLHRKTIAKAQIPSKMRPFSPPKKITFFFDFDA